MTICDPQSMSKTILAWVQFCKVIFIFVWWFFSSCTCLFMIVFVLAICFIWYSRILLISIIWRIVGIIWSMWILSMVVANVRLSSAEAMSLVGTTTFTLWYLVFPTLSFWVSLSKWFLSAKNFFKPIHIHSQNFPPLFADWYKFQMLRPRVGPSGWPVPLCTGSCHCRCNGLIHLCVWSNCQSVRTSQLDCSFTYFWLRAMQLWFSCSDWSDAWGDCGTWL